MFKFTIQAKIPGKLGRAGLVETPHGVFETPAFIPVATKATIKALTVDEVKTLVGAQVILANTYHLYLQPGTDVLEKAGGLHKFMNWSGPTFTDSGGFQAFSLAFGLQERKSKISTGSTCANSSSTGSTWGNEESPDHSPLAKVTDEGVAFRSVIDGSAHFFTPEKSIEIQQAIGADIIFAFDECISPEESKERQAQAVKRTEDWAKRCLNRHKELEEEKKKSGKNPQALFGIVQGGRFEDLRRSNAQVIGSMDFDGFGIGGSFDKRDIGTAVGWVSAELPEDKPRHLLGIGDPGDLLDAIENGVDTFDCVAPTRLGRNGTAYVSSPRSDLGKTINLLNARYTTDFSPIDSRCTCHTCKNYSRAYLAHLFRAKEILAATLTSVHNLYFVSELVRQARRNIIEKGEVGS